MPDSRSHRGAHPADRQLFGSGQLPQLRAACDELCWLMTRGYASRSALKLVGDRHRLVERQRLAVLRCAGSEQALADIGRTQQLAAAVRRSSLWLDGYNILTSVEAALAGGVILLARDGCIRDMASMHGTWRRVEETVPAIGHVGWALHQLGCARCVWLLDRPVSNSGRLKQMLQAQAAAEGWDWQVELHPNPDRELAVSAETIASSDREILVKCRRWFNLTRYVIETRLADVWTVDLSQAAQLS